MFRLNAHVYVTNIISANSPSIYDTTTVAKSSTVHQLKPFSGENTNTVLKMSLKPVIPDLYALFLVVKLYQIVERPTQVRSTTPPVKMRNGLAVL